MEEKISTLNLFKKLTTKMKNMISRHLKFIKCLEEEKKRPTPKCIMVEFGNSGNKQKLPGRKSKTKDWEKEIPTTALEIRQQWNENFKSFSESDLPNPKFFT